MEMLNYHLKNTDLNMNTTYVRQGHVGAILSLIGACSKNINYVQPYLNIIQTCASKWLNQFMTLTEFEVSVKNIVILIYICILKYARFNS